jgi:hypothetical protein
MGSTNGRFMVQADQGIKQDLISKITNAIRAGGVAQVIGCLPSKRDIMSSTSRAIKNKI